MKNFNFFGVGIAMLCRYFLVGLITIGTSSIYASSHREAPLISNDPLADNVDLYAFRSPDDPNTVTLIATYIPMQLPHGGPNYYNFGEHVRYEIHVDNDASVSGDEITYRFTFNIENEDPTTFFNIRLGKQNQKATYTLERSTDAGMTFMTIIENGIVPPNNIGDRSIESGVGLGTTYAQLYTDAITEASTGERVFAGPTDDPFFVDLGGVFDLGDSPRQSGKPVDGLACYNVHSIAIQVPIATLLKNGASTTPTDILDPDYVIGVWASASRPAMKTISRDADPVYSGDWIQVSRLGMPLTNEAIIPIGDKDYWNSITPYEELADTKMDAYFYNPELALYMDDDLFGGAVPSFAALRIQTNSLGAFDFSNGGDGLFGLKGADALAGTALDDAVFGTLLLPGPGQPRSVDLWPIFHTGVPNVIPYQLATGKDGNPLAAGKPFINNFLPNGGDMLRLNMAVPVTSRDDANFSSLGLVQAAAIGLTVAPFNTNLNLEFIPNMDGFPNGRRLEDDVTRIELQAVGGIVLAAVGLWYDDYDPATSASPVTQDLLNVLTYTTGVENNDKPFSTTFPYLAMPHSGTGACSGTFQNDENEEECNVVGGDLVLSDGMTSSSICVGDGISDMIHVTLTGEQGAASAWIITDEDGTILDLPETFPFDFEGAGSGTCNIYNVSFSGMLDILEVGVSLSDLQGCFALSNPVTIVRNSGGDCNDDVENGCPTPKNIKVRMKSSNKYIVSWDRVADVRGYNIRVGIKGAPKSDVVVPVKGRRIIVSVPAGKIFEIAIQTNCKDGSNSNYSELFTLGSNSKKAANRSLEKGDIQVSKSGIVITEFSEVFPNPVQQVLNLAFDTGDEAALLSVYDLQGRKMLIRQLKSSEIMHRLDVSSLGAGTYIIMGKGPDGQVRMQEKFIKVANY